MTHLVRQGAITSDEDVVGDRLPEHLDLQCIRNNLLGLTIYVRVDERDIVVARNDVSQSTQSLLDSLDGDVWGKGISEVLQLLVSRGGRDEETVSVSSG